MKLLAVEIVKTIGKKVTLNTTTKKHVYIFSCNTNKKISAQKSTKHNFACTFCQLAQLYLISQLFELKESKQCTQRSYG